MYVSELSIVECVTVYQDNNHNLSWEFQRADGCSSILLLTTFLLSSDWYKSDLSGKRSPAEYLDPQLDAPNKNPVNPLP